MLCPDGFDNRIWVLSEKIAIENKLQAETSILELDWETTYSEMMRKDIHHNVCSSLEELTREWYQFGVMMISHKDPYWTALYSLTNPI